jgi:hypothetical protein
VAARSGSARLDRWDALLLLAGAAAVLLVLAAERRIAGAWGLPLDDGWIHLRLARNLATGGGLAINPGEPVPASTAPLWSVLLAGLLAIGMPGLLAAKTLGLACWAGTGLVTRRLARAAGLAAGPAWAAGLTTVLLGRLVWGALSGMEVPLAALTVAAAAWAVAAGRPGLGAAGFGLATLARPEAGLLAALHAVGAGRWGEALRRGGVAAGIVVPAALFNLAAGGRLVPTTAAAKVEGGLLGQREGLAGAWSVAAARLPAFLGDWLTVLYQDHVALPALVAAGLVASWTGRLRWLALGLVLHPVAVALIAPYRGPGFQTGRYSAHLLPLAVVVAVLGLERFLHALARPGIRIAVGVALLVSLGFRLPAAAKAYAWGVQNINAMQVTLGRWVAARTPRDTLIAVNDVGALSYFGERRVIDLVGLATPEILPYRREGSDGVLRYLRRRCPEYLVIFPDWFPELAEQPDLFRPLTAVTLALNVVAGGSTMVVYETPWARTRRPVAPGCAAAPSG